MEPTDFEKWCAGEVGHTVEFIMSMRRKEKYSNNTVYFEEEIHIRYRAYMAGVCSRLPYQHPVKQTPEE